MFIDMPVLIQIKKHLNEKYWGFQLTNEFAFLMRYSAMGFLDKLKMTEARACLKDWISAKWAASCQTFSDINSISEG